MAKYHFLNFGGWSAHMRALYGWRGSDLLVRDSRGRRIYLGSSRAPINTAIATTTSFVPWVGVGDGFTRIDRSTDSRCQVELDKNEPSSLNSWANQRNGAKKNAIMLLYRRASLRYLYFPKRRSFVGPAAQHHFFSLLYSQLGSSERPWSWPDSS